MIDHAPTVKQVNVFEEETKAEHCKSRSGPDQTVLHAKVFLAEVGVEAGCEEDLRGEYHTIQADSYHVQDVRCMRTEMIAVF